MPLARQLIHKGLTSSVPLVRRTYSFSFKSLAVDRNHTVSQRIKPNSRTAFTGEQPDPSELLHPEDATSRHRFSVSLKILALYLEIAALLNQLRLWHWNFVLHTF